MINRKHNYKKLLAMLCAFSGVFAGGSNSFAAGNKTGKKGTKVSNANSTGNVNSGGSVQGTGVFDSVKKLAGEHPVASGVTSGAMIGGLALGAFALVKSKGWWRKAEKPEPPVEDDDDQKTPPKDVYKVVCGSSLIRRNLLKTVAYSYSNGKLGSQYYYKNGGATNSTMRRAVVEKLLLDGGGSQEAVNMLLGYNANGEYVLFRLEKIQQNQPGKYVIVFDNALWAKMTMTQKNAIKDYVFEKGGVAFLGVEISKKVQDGKDSYEPVFKNIGEIGYSADFCNIDGKEYFIFNNKKDNVAIKNEKLEDSLSNLSMKNLVVSDKQKGKARVADDSKSKASFIDSLPGFGAKVNDDQKLKQQVYDNCAVYDIQKDMTKLLVFNVKCHDVFCNLFKDQFFAYGGYGFVIFEKGKQDNVSWEATKLIPKYDCRYFMNAVGNKPGFVFKLNNPS